MPTFTLSSDDFSDGSIGLLNMMVKGGLASSNGEARRLVIQGGVSVNDQKITDASYSVKKADFANGIIVKKGKKAILRFITE